MLETLAVIFTLISVWLTRKQNIWCWLTGIIGTVCFYFIFRADHSVANMNLQILIIIQGLYGWVTWGKDDEKPIKLSNNLTLTLEVSTTLVIVLFLLILDLNLSFLDITTTAITIMAMTLIAHKKLESWIYWMVADVFYIIYFIYFGHWLSMLLFAILFINALFAFKEWKRDIKVLTY
jgi:nicotinamide mononucleotide transporter